MTWTASKVPQHATGQPGTASRETHVARHTRLMPNPTKSISRVMPTIVGIAKDIPSFRASGYTSWSSKAQMKAGMIPEVNDISDNRRMTVRDRVPRETHNAMAAQMNQGTKGNANAIQSPDSLSVHHGAPASAGSTTATTTNIKSAQAAGR